MNLTYQKNILSVYKFFFHKCTFGDASGATSFIEKNIMGKFFCWHHWKQAENIITRYPIFLKARCTKCNKIRDGIPIHKVEPDNRFMSIEYYFLNLDGFGLLDYKK